MADINHTVRKCVLGIDKGRCILEAYRGVCNYGGSATIKKVNYIKKWLFSNAGTTIKAFVRPLRLVKDAFIITKKAPYC